MVLKGSRTRQKKIEEPLASTLTRKSATIHNVFPLYFRERESTWEEERGRERGEKGVWGEREKKEEGEGEGGKRGE